MQTIFKVSLISRQTGFSKSALALLLAAQVLFVTTAGSSQWLHRLIHSEAASPNHQCAITLFEKGLIGAAVACAIPLAMASLFGGVELLADTFILPLANYRFSPSRAPPCPSA
ncbi:MAG TPA: hypothetical protein VH598_15765 [Verrucomicrobiae bacterium]|nr:hypothetical protein [Verrucomicrobiae bacterium]